MLIPLTCDCYILPEEVSEITINKVLRSGMIRMKNGIGHPFSADAGKSIGETAERLCSVINDATKREAVCTPGGWDAAAIARITKERANDGAVQETVDGQSFEVRHDDYLDSLAKAREFKASQTWLKGA